MADAQSDPTPIEESGNTILGIRMEIGLREQIKELARAEGRTESGFVRFYLAKLVEGSEGGERGEPGAAGNP